MNTPKATVKKVANTTLTLGIFATKALEAVIPTMIALQKDPSPVLNGLVASTGLATFSAPFTIKDENEWVDKAKFLGIIPWGILLVGVNFVPPAYYPAAWFVSSLGIDYVLRVIDASIHHIDLSKGDVSDLAIEGIKRALLAALILTDGFPGSAIVAIKQQEDITSNQFYLSATSAAVAFGSLSFSAGRAIYRLFKPQEAPSVATDQPTQLELTV